MRDALSWLLLQVARNFSIFVEFLDEVEALMPVFVVVRSWGVGIVAHLLAIERSLLALFEDLMRVVNALSIGHTFLSERDMLNGSENAPRESRLGPESTLNKQGVNSGRRNGTNLNQVASGMAKAQDNRCLADHAVYASDYSIACRCASTQRASAGRL